MSEPCTAEEVLTAKVEDLARDILLALRYFYYFKAMPVVPDAIYDTAEKEYLSRVTTDEFSTPLNEPGSDRQEDYPDRIRALALYIYLDAIEKRKT